MNTNEAWYSVMLVSSVPENKYNNTLRKIGEILFREFLKK